MKAPEDFKVGQVWQDGTRDDLYFIKNIGSNGILINWIRSPIMGDEEEFVSREFYKIAFTHSDVYVRELTELEKELL
jgi:hypothetical protein